MQKRDENILNESFEFFTNSDEPELIVVDSFEEFEFLSTTPTNISVTQIPDIIEEKEVKTIVTRKHKSDPQITFEEKSLSPPADEKIQKNTQEIEINEKLKFKIIRIKEKRLVYVREHIREELNKLMMKGYCNTFTDFLHDDFGQIQTLESWLQTNGELKNRVIDQFKEIMFQVLWGLMVAQQEIRFMHKNINTKNIMIKPLLNPQFYCLKRRCDPNNDQIWCCRYYEVRICNFEHSQLKYSENGNYIQFGFDEIIFDKSYDRKRLFETLSDVTISDYNRYSSYEKILYEDFIQELSNNGCHYDTSYFLKECFFNSLKRVKKGNEQETIMFTYEVY